MASTIFVALAAAVLIGESSAFQCYTCASASLRNNWQLTGYPKRLSNDLFAETDCDTKEAVESWSKSQTGALVTCSDACVTLMLETPDALGFAQDTLFVRGCQADLLGYTSSNAITAETCFAGMVKRLDSKGERKSLDSQLTTCVSDKCNTEDKFLNKDGGTCAGSDNAKVVNCEQCWSVGEDCSGSSSCSGAWCTKSAGYIGDTMVVSKGCAPFNTLGKESVCAEVDTTAFFPTFVGLTGPQGLLEKPAPKAVAHRRAKRGNLAYEGKMCFCNGEKCNGAAGVGVSLAALVCLGLLAFQLQ